MNTLSQIHSLNKHCLKCFRAVLQKKLHIRGLAEECNLHPGQVQRAVKTLLNHNLIVLEKQGNQKMIHLARNEWSQYIRSGIALEKHMQLPTRRRRATQFFHSRLLDVTATVVFGSTATDTFTDESDIDILILSENESSYEDASRYAESQTGITVDTFTITTEEFTNEVVQKQDSLVQSAINTGWPYYNRQQYYALLDETQPHRRPR